MSSVFGNRIKVSIFGQSHAQVVGVSIDGLPAGESIDTAELGHFMERRAPGRSAFSTKRKEPDQVEILTGVVNGRTCGAPLMALIRNTDCRSQDYQQLRDLPRPSHADYVAEVKHKGFQDVRGGGHFSGRLTAALCIAGGIFKQLLLKKGIRIGAHIYNIGGLTDPLFDGAAILEKTSLMALLQRLEGSSFPTLDSTIGEAMQARIEEYRKRGDSIGGGVECMVLGLPVGIGGGLFGGLENHISAAVFGVPAVKGIEFGNGFASMSLSGSENNDDFCLTSEGIKTVTNRHGGILGGISSGMPLIFRVAIKATPSISLPQQSVSLSQQKETTLKVEGRHDPCIAPRAVPVIEAVAAMAVYDLVMDSGY